MKEIKLKITLEGADAVKDVQKEVKNLDTTADKSQKSVKDLAKESGVLSKEMSMLNRIQGTYNTLMEKMGLNTATATAGTSGLARMMNILRIALIKTGIGAIAVAVGTLAAAFVSTQEGADRLNRALAPLTMMFQRIWGIIQDLSLDIVEALADPKQAFKDLGQIILDNLINRLRAIPMMGQAALDLLVATFQSAGAGIRLALADVPLIGRGIDADQAREDLNQATDGIKAGFKDLTTATSQLTTGIEGGIGRIGNAIRNLYNEVKEDAHELFDLQRDLQIRQAEMLVPMAKIRAEYEEQRTLANDVSQTLEEQLAASERAIELQQKLVDEEQAQLDMEIRILEIKQAQNDTSREEDMELQRLLARRIEIESQAERSNRNMIRRQSRIREEIRKTTEAEAEAARLAAEEREKLLAEREEADRLAAEDRILREREIRNRLRELDAEDWEEELEIRAERAELERDMRMLELEREIEDEEMLKQELALVEAEYQDELSQLERQGANERKAIAQAELDLRRQIALEMASVLDGLTRLIGEQTVAGKALAIAAATIDTYVGANKALAQGGILGPIAAAGVIATGLANVRQILATQVPSIQGQPLGTPASAPNIQAAQAEPVGMETVETVFQTDETEAQRVYVTETDVTETQNRVRVIEEDATF